MFDECYPNGSDGVLAVGGPTYPEMITESKVGSDFEEDDGDNLDIEDNGVKS